MSIKCLLYIRGVCKDTEEMISAVQWCHGFLTSRTLSTFEKILNQTSIYLTGNIFTSSSTLANAFKMSHILGLVFNRSSTCFLYSDGLDKEDGSTSLPACSHLCPSSAMRTQLRSSIKPRFNLATLSPDLDHNEITIRVVIYAQHRIH
jgi:hypothetical protein